MLGETNVKVFTDVTASETISLLIIVGVLFFFGMYPKPINDLITPALEQILLLTQRY
jgi:NADH-quinone oxidoreductase subunit M